ncbi:MAG: hypothetical protein WA708_15365 [Acidobacteriaceae bacterium]
MKRLLSTFFLCAYLASIGHIWAVTLPGSCGDDKIQFDVKTEKGQPGLAAPATGKAQIVFIENENQMIGPFMHATVRYGVDGAWVGANNGSSIFALTVDPGVHHLCANWQSDLKRFGKNAEATSFTADPDKVYCFAASVTVESKDVVNFGFSQMNEDEGQYQVKGSKKSTSKPK